MNKKNKFSKKDIIEHICQTSNDVSDHFDKLYLEDIDLFAEDIAISFNILIDIIDRPRETQVSDADFQSAFLFWNALNTLIAAIEIFRRGYLKEPGVLSRNILEAVGTAYDIHKHPKKLPSFLSGKYKSAKSIGLVKKLSPVIGTMYGQLSQDFSHIGGLYVLPQGSYYPGRGRSLWIGGGLSENDRESHFVLLIDLMMTLDIINAVMEFVFYEEIEEHRFWARLENGTYEHFPIKRIQERAARLKKKNGKFVARKR